MSVHIENFANWVEVSRNFLFSLDFANVVPVGILGASLLGSAHCLGMCGGLVLAIAPTPMLQKAYHLGRGVAYLGLGVISGLLGERLFSMESELDFLQKIAFVGLAIFLVYSGVRLFLKMPMHYSSRLNIWPNLQRSLLKLESKPHRAFLSGSLSAFLPCGWLYSFVFAASATSHPLKGGGLMLFFWLGTLPVLMSSGVILEKVIRPIMLRIKKSFGAATGQFATHTLTQAAGIFLVVLGFWVIGVKSHLASNFSNLDRERTFSGQTQRLLLKENESDSFLEPQHSCH